MLMDMPSLANDGSSFRIHHRSSAMSAAPLAPADASSMGPSTLPADAEAPPPSSTMQRPAEQPQGSLPEAAPEQPQSSMPVLEASHRGSLILTAYIEPRTGSFRVRPSEEVLQFAELDYTAVVRVVRLAGCLTQSAVSIYRRQSDTSLTVVCAAADDTRPPCSVQRAQPWPRSCHCTAQPHDLGRHGYPSLPLLDYAQVEEKAVAAQQTAAVRIADLAKAAASGVPVLADPGQPSPPSPARAALADIAGRLEKLHRGATMHLRLNRIAHGARLLGLRPVSLPHGMLKVSERAAAAGSCCRLRGGAYIHSNALGSRVARDMKQCGERRSR